VPAQLSWIATRNVRASEIVNAKVSPGRDPALLPGVRSLAPRQECDEGSATIGQQLLLLREKETGSNCLAASVDVSVSVCLLSSEAEPGFRNHLPGSRQSIQPYAVEMPSMDWPPNVLCLRVLLGLCFYCLRVPPPSSVRVPAPLRHSKIFQKDALR